MREVSKKAITIHNIVTFHRSH